MGSTPPMVETPPLASSPTALEPPTIVSGYTHTLRDNNGESVIYDAVSPSLQSPSFR